MEDILSCDLYIVDKLTGKIADLLGQYLKQSWVYVGDELGTNPLPDEVQTALKYTDTHEYFRKLGVSTIQYSKLEDELKKWQSSEGKSETAKKNTLVKCMAWSNRLRRLFSIKAANGKAVYICTGDSGKIVRYYLNWLVQCGITVIMYLPQGASVSVDGKSLRLSNDTSEVMGYLTIDELKQKLSCKKQEIKLKEVQTSDLLTLDIDKSVQYAVHYSGVADDLNETGYCNMLFNFQKKLGDKCIVVEGSIPNISPQEVDGRITQHSNEIHKLDDIFKFVSVSDRVKQVLTNVVSNYNITGISNIITLYYMYYRYTSLINKQGYLLILTDRLSKKSVYILDVLMQFGVNIFVFNPSGVELQLPKEFKTFNENKVLHISQFPKGLGVESMTTVASQAESVIESELYGTGVGIYKDMQFKSAKIIMLDTTFEEIEQLWNTDMRFRQGFDDSDEGSVTLPVITAKISGVPFSSVSEYSKWLGKLDGEGVLVFKDSEVSKTKCITVYIANLLKSGTRELDFDRVKKSSYYSYGYLKDSTQDYIISKISELLNYGIIDGVYKSGVENTVCSVLFSLQERMLNLIQSFDFTKRNPKAIFIRTTKEPMSLETTIYANFLSLVGFDVLYIVPTGYNVLDKYLKTALYKEYEYGNYDFSSKVDVKGKSSFFSRLKGLAK